jgi:hypothetical protein
MLGDEAMLTTIQKQSQVHVPISRIISKSAAPRSFPSRGDDSRSVTLKSDESKSIAALELHTRALEVSTRYKRAEAELLEVLDQVDRKRVFLQFGASSLYSYCVEILKLSESVTYNLIAVMRKSREIPELREQSMQGTITLSNARRVAAVLTPENKNEWLTRAATLSARQLEREISKVLPSAATQERATYVAPTRVKLELGLSESEMLKFRKIQDQISQSRQKSVSLEETLMELMNFYLSRKCPIEKAKRHVVKKGISVSEERAAQDGDEISPARASETKCDTQVLGSPAETTPRLKNTRTPIPAKILHAVHLRDQRKCQYPARSEKVAPSSSVLTSREAENSKAVCGQTRFLEVHHVRPVAQGGDNSLKNLITLCATHHEWIHAKT